jgi:hypothetical protein
MPITDEQLLAHILATPNRGDFHIFLGHPLSDGCDKTVVEPGGAFSPGAWTCGISLWLLHDGTLVSPDTLSASDLRFTFADDGLPPLLRSHWSAGPISVRVDQAHLNTEGSHGVDFARYTLSSPAPATVEAILVIRDLGPAGGPLRTLAWDEIHNTLTTDSGIRLTLLNRQASAQISTTDSPGSAASPLALLRIPLRLRSSEPTSIDLRVEHAFNNAPFAYLRDSRSPFADLNVDSAFASARANWQQQLPARLFAPDPRIESVWQRCAFHLMAAMECGLPRIGAINYPHFWMRDGVIVLRALDILGRHDLARLGAEHLAPLYFSGGFGAEADAPGEGIWALVQHALITQDTAFLRTIFPHLQARVDWIFRMLTARKPLREVGQNRIAFYTDIPGIDVVCLPSADGLIRGRMDWHSPNFYINCWACAGLLNAADAAQMIHRPELATLWREHGLELERALSAHLLPHYGNDRDPAVAPHPTGIYAGNVTELKRRFTTHFRQHRLTPDGARKREPLWTYFEAASIHNAILLGYPELAWAALDGMLSDGPYEVSAFVEGTAGGNECLPFRNGENRRGWLRPDAVAGNMPHNWTSAEMLLLLRSIFVDDSDGELILGRGIPDAWLTPGSTFGVENLPTRLGVISYRATVDPDGKANLELSGASTYKPLFPVR